MVEEQRDMIAEANAAAESLRQEREKLEALHKTMQEQETRMILGGKSNAGETVVEKVETAKEYAQRMLRGGK